MDFVIEIYNEIQRFPAHEKFGVAAQLQRAAVSRSQATSLKEQQEETRESCCSFLYIARGSLSELDTQLEICLRLGYLEKPAYDRLVLKLETISRMLSGLIASIAKKTRT